MNKNNLHQSDCKEIQSQNHSDLKNIENSDIDQIESDCEEIQNYSDPRIPRLMTNQILIIEKSKSTMFLIRRILKILQLTNQIVKISKECNKSFPKNLKLTLHTKRVHNEKTFVCNICNYRFSENYQLRAYENKKSFKSVHENTNLFSWVRLRGPVIQANGRLTFEDDLRSGGLLCFISMNVSVRRQHW